MIAKILIGGAIAVAAAVNVAAPATADPLTTTVDTCTCQPPAQKAGIPAPGSEQLDQGLRRALSDMQAGASR